MLESRGNGKDCGVNARNRLVGRELEGCILNYGSKEHCGVSVVARTSPPHVFGRPAK